MSGHTQARVTSDGFDLQHTTTDSLILPAANLEQLQKIDPSLVAFVIDQTKQEAEFRRSETKRTNNIYLLKEYQV